MLDPDIRSFYELGLEDARLSKGPGRLEAARLRELIERFLPKPPGVVLDVGGGSGAYARWLAGLGYAVHLVDPVPLHVEQARASRGEPALASATVGDARALAFPDGAADAVLMSGPLYHLVERADRLQALREAGRAVRPGGLILAVGISRFSPIFSGLSRKVFDDPAAVDLIRGVLRGGQHRNPTRKIEYFTTAFFHHPDELRKEAEQAGLRVEALLAVEGPGWLVQDLDFYWETPARRALLLELIRAVEAEPALLGMSSHLLVVARKADSAAAP